MTQKAISKPVVSTPSRSLSLPPDPLMIGAKCWRGQRGDAVYAIKYRVFGRQRFATIGRHGSPWTPDKARREAKRPLGLVAAGKDPQAEKAEARAKAADTLGKSLTTT